MILLLKMAPKHSAEVLIGVLKCKKAARCLTEKMCVLGKLCAGMRYIEFSVTESVIYIKQVSLNRNPHETWLCIDRLMQV